VLQSIWDVSYVTASTSGLDEKTAKLWSLAARAKQANALQHLASATALAPGVPSVDFGVAGRRMAELAWRRANPEALNAFQGEWVALEGDRIVGHSRNAGDAIKQARAAGVRVPYVFLVEAPDNTMKIGL
jgi:hypothetical protein